MIETGNTDIDVDEIMTKIKAEVSKRNEGGLKVNNGDDVFADEMLSSFDRHHLKVNIGIAEENSVIGRSEFSMLRFNKMVRWFAKFASRIVLYLTRIITFPQTNFNLAILNVIHIFRDGLINLERRLNHHENLVSQLAEQVTELQKKIQDQSSKIDSQEQINSYLQAGIAMYESRLSMFLEEAKERLPESFSPEQLDQFSAEADHMFDPLYLSFEDRFRGNRQQIKERLQVYLPLIEKSNAGIDNYPILDIGCGRGEWIELISENKRSIIGVDLNRTLVDQCVKQGMDVIEEDAVKYLRSLADNSMGAITAFHLIEHLPLKTLLAFLNESLRVLRKDGIILLETPNPENVIVGSCTFYFDPTHRNPLPPDMVQFLLESRGFYHVSIQKLHPYPDEAKIPDDGTEIVKRFNQRFYGPQDFAVIGYKL